jgi:hypothetical protein
MTLWLVLLLSGASPGELQVARSWAEVPAAWRRSVPRNFDFSNEMLAFSPGLPGPVVELSRQVKLEYEATGALTVLLEHASPCPKGVGTPVFALPQGDVFRLPRARGPVRVVTRYVPADCSSPSVLVPPEPSLQ